MPAAPQDCLPVVGCVTTTVPSVTLPTVTLPTLPISTTTIPLPIGTTTSATTGPDGSTTSTTGSTGATTTATTATDTTARAPEAGLSVGISVRVVGHGAGRSIVLRLRLTKAARVSALLSRNGKTLARRQFTARAGTSVWKLRIGRAVKPGAARLGLTYRSSTGETARSSHRLRLPR